MGRTLPNHPSERPFLHLIPYLHFVQCLGSTSDDVSIGNVNISPGVTISVSDGKKISVYGTLQAGSGVTFTKVSGGTYWSGIDIKNGGTLSATGSFTIEYADTGIDMDSGSSLSNGTNRITIRNCRQAGIGVNNCSPTIQNIYCENVSTSTYQNGGITVTGSSANPTIVHCTVKGNSADTGTYYGIKVGIGSTGTDVVDSDIQSSVYSHSVQVNADCLINLNDYSPGNNIVRRNSGVKAINNPSTGSISAQYNWWGANPPQSDFFTFPGNVDYTLHCTGAVSGAGALRTVIKDLPDSLALARQYERNGDYAEAVRLYKLILANEKNIYKRKYAVSAILRCIDKNGKDYSGLRLVLQKELADTTFLYRAPLDFIESDILFREGRYQEAIDSFSAKLEKYRGTYMETEMLVRISQMYGDYLNNHAKAKEFADKAAAVNPGQETLRYAYAASGVAYNPIEHENRFALNYDGLQPPTQPESKPAEFAISEYVSISPNPANPVTTITYSIKSPSLVKLSIYAINGQKVATLVDGPVSAGVHAVKFDGSKYASGVYFYRFESSGLTKTGKMLLLK